MRGNEREKKSLARSSNMTVYTEVKVSWFASMSFDISISVNANMRNREGEWKHHLSV